MDALEQKLTVWRNDTALSLRNNYTKFNTDQEYNRAFDELDNAFREQLLAGKKIDELQKEIARFTGSAEKKDENEDETKKDAENTLEFLKFTYELLEKTDSRIFRIKISKQIVDEIDRMASKMQANRFISGALRRPMPPSEMMKIMVPEALGKIPRQSGVAVTNVRALMEKVPANFAKMSMEERTLSIFRNLDEAGLKSLSGFSRAMHVVDRALIAATVMLIVWSVVEAKDRDTVRVAAREVVIALAAASATAGAVAALTAIVNPAAGAAVVAVYLVGMLIGVVVGQGAAWLFDCLFSDAPPALSEEMSIILTEPMTTELAIRFDKKLSTLLSG